MPPIFDRVLVDNVFVGFGRALFVVHVPTKGLKERVEELPAQLCFIILAGGVVLQIECKSLGQRNDFQWCGHIVPVLLWEISGTLKLLKTYQMRQGVSINETVSR